MDWDHESVAEAVVVAAAALARHDQSGRLELLLPVLSGQARDDVVPLVGGVAEAVLVDDLLRHAALFEIGVGRVVGKSEGLVEGERGIIDDLEEIVLVRLAHAALAPRQLDPHPRRHMLHRLGEREALRQGEELEDVAAGAATEAVEEPLVAIDMK